MNKNVFHILESMIEDNQDRYVCYEIIEPYVNANIDKELADSDIVDILTKMQEQELIQHCVSEDDKYVPFDGDISMRHSWFCPTKKGEKAYNKQMETE